MTYEEIGEKVVDLIISGALLGLVRAVGTPVNVLPANDPDLFFVWSANAAEQIGALIQEMVSDKP